MLTSVLVEWILIIKSEIEIVYGKIIPTHFVISNAMLLNFLIKTFYYKVKQKPVNESKTRPILQNMHIIIYSSKGIFEWVCETYLCL